MVFANITSGLIGVAVGDALGVPYEFKSAAGMALHPATDMVGHGTHNQLPGTWSDDSSLTFCLAESLTSGYNLLDMATKFAAWQSYGYWSARGKVFDIGITTATAISKLHHLAQAKDLTALQALRLNSHEQQNGNGSLMRILPLVAYTRHQPLAEKFESIWQVSALTHPPLRAAMACQLYLEIAQHLLEGLSKVEAYQAAKQIWVSFWQSRPDCQQELPHFERVLVQDIQAVPKSTLRSGGYVMETLEASLWCLLNTDTFEDAVLTAVNLGHDTDTTAAVTGGLAGMLYGIEGIPEFWLVSIARMEDILDLGERLDATNFA